MLARRLLVVVAALTFLVATASSPGCSSTVEGPTTSSTAAATGGASSTGNTTGVGVGGHGGAAGSTPAAGSTGGASSGGGGGSGGGSTGGGGSCALCAAAFNHTNPAPPSSLCTQNGPESSKQYFDAFETCCNTNCASRCDCPHPYGILSGLCQLCRAQYCEAELLACGQCDPCNAVLQGSGDISKLCTAGSTPTSSARWSALSQCACTACPQACADDACMGLVLGDACIACAQTNCPDELQSCASDDMPTSG